MADEKQKEIAEVRASARRVHISPRKARLVANLLKTLPVEQALLELQFRASRATVPIRKLVTAAIANAAHNFQIEADRLYVKNITVDGAEVMMRYKPRAQGRAFPVRKRTSHINLILGVRPGLPKKKAAPTKVEAEAEVGKETKPAVEVKAAVSKPEQPKRRWGFLRRRPRQEFTKGKKYTGFDRRSGS
ncbi:MAG: 50S ribosomal protein L22 [Candidatus Doudnabacteria bacterium]|nr:50S ribosomal protein L22 [Candidatus Doudnabacteria bacterium]